jgi:hypothetical protein
MEGGAFDRMARLLVATPTRRIVFRALAGLALGGITASLRDDTAAKHRKSHKKCKPCQRKKHGKCKGNMPTGTRCNGDGQCFQGTCVPRPDCAPAGSICDPGVLSCCSHLCLVLKGSGICGSGGAGLDCLTSDDCTAPLSCVAYRCR